MASQHCLNQLPTLNAGLQATNAAQLKVKLSTLKKQVKGDMITMEVTLFYYPKSGTAAKKVKTCYLTCFISIDVPISKAQLLPILKKFFVSDPAKSALDYAQSELQKTWVESPASNVGGMNTLNFEECAILSPILTLHLWVLVLCLE